MVVLLIYILIMYPWIYISYYMPRLYFDLLLDTSFFPLDFGVPGLPTTGEADRFLNSIDT